MPSKQNVDYLNFSKTVKQIATDETSKKIDFVLAENNNRSIIINAFDVTINIQSAQKKIQKFFYEFSNFVDKEEQTINLSIPMNVELNYAVLVSKLPQNGIQWVGKINKAITFLKEDKEKLTEKPITQSKKNKKSLAEKTNSKLENAKKLETEKTSSKLENAKKFQEEKTSSQLENAKKLQEEKNLIKIKLQRLDKRIEFLQNLSIKENLLQSKYELEIIRSSECKTLLTNVAIVAVFDAQITNESPGQISFYKGLLEQAKIDMKKE